MSKILKKLGRYGKKSAPPLPPTPDYANEIIGALNLETKSNCVNAENGKVILCEEYEDPFDFKDNDEYDSSTESYYTSPYQSEGTPQRYSCNPSPSESKDSELYDYPISEGSCYEDVCVKEKKERQEQEEQEDRFVKSIISKIECLSEDYEKRRTSSGPSRLAKEQRYSSEDRARRELRKKKRAPATVAKNTSISSKDSLSTDETGSISSMATKSKSRGGQQIYETAFDSKMIGVRLNGNTAGSAIEKVLHKSSLHNILYPNTFSSKTPRRGSESSTSFTPEHSSRSSTASSCSSHGSATSTPQHLNQLPRALLPKSKQSSGGPAKLHFRIPRSKSSDFNLSRLSTTAIPENCNVIKSDRKVQAGLESGETQLTAATGCLKAATSDTISSFDSIYDSDSSSRCLLREKRNHKYKNLINILEDGEKIMKQRLAREPKLTKENLHLILSPPSGIMGKTEEELNSSHVSRQPSNLTSCSASSSSAQLNLVLKRKELINEKSFPPAQLQSPQNDSRPLNDYDAPWDSNKRLSTMVTRIINTAPANDKCLDGSSMTGTKSITGSMEPNDEEVALKPSGEEQTKSSSSLAIKKEAVKPSTEIAIGSTGSATPPVTPDVPSLPKVKPTLEKPEQRTRGVPPSLNLSLNFNNDGSSKSRKQLGLNFPPIPLQTNKETIDVAIPLEKQGWFHGTITRLDAENLLRTTKEGSFLIRNCESSKQDYSLSLKSAKGFMHMKIVKESDGRYVLGVFSKPFNSIPDMVHHYSINKLPIRGAEHMSLLHPVIDQLL